MVLLQLFSYFDKLLNLLVNVFLDFNSVLIFKLNFLQHFTFHNRVFFDSLDNLSAAFNKLRVLISLEQLVEYFLKFHILSKGPIGVLLVTKQNILYQGFCCSEQSGHILVYVRDFLTDDDMLIVGL